MGIVRINVFRLLGESVGKLFADEGCLCSSRHVFFVVRRTEVSRRDLHVIKV